MTSDQICIASSGKEKLGRTTHHQVVLTGWSSLTFPSHPSQSFIAPGMSSRLHPVSVQRFISISLYWSASTFTSI